jgi:hypothetical protein
MTILMLPGVDLKQFGRLWERKSQGDPVIQSTCPDEDSGQA